MVADRQAECGRADDCVVEGGREEVPPVCQFKRGVCSMHGVKGVKRVEEQKRWTKLKNGFGWRTTRKVKYTCTFTDKKPVSSNQTDDIGPSTSLSGERKSNISNFSNFPNFSNISSNLEDSGGARIESESTPTSESSNLL